MENNQSDPAYCSSQEKESRKRAAFTDEDSTTTCAYSDDNADKSRKRLKLRKQTTTGGADSPGKNRDERSDDERGQAARRRKEKLEQNRISAMKSRLRKKLAAEELKKVHDNLLAEYNLLKQKNDMLSRCLAEVESKSIAFDDKLGPPGVLATAAPLVPSVAPSANIDPSILQAALMNPNIAVSPYAGMMPSLTSATTLPIGSLLNHNKERKNLPRNDLGKNPFGGSKIP